MTLRRNSPIKQLESRNPIVASDYPASSEQNRQTVKPSGKVIAKKNTNLQNCITQILRSFQRISVLVSKNREQTSLHLVL